MIKDKKTFIFLIDSIDKEMKIKNFIKRTVGRESNNLDYITKSYGINESYLFEVTYDLLEDKITKLSNSISNIFYTTNKKYMHRIDEFMEWYENEYLVLKDYVVIKHIPHASLEFPEGSVNTLMQYDIYKYNLRMSDVGVDNLFKFIEGIDIKAKYSRLFCDVERFKDDNLEPMSKLGQGYIYKKLYDGSPIFRNEYINGIKEIDFINQYYDEHHKRINDETTKILKSGKKVLLLDLHSFSDTLADSLGKKGPYPDICIGINDKYYDPNVLKIITKKIVDKGYSYSINFPYEGSLIPQVIMNGDIEGEICSIMIEVNKRIYL